VLAHQRREERVQPLLQPCLLHGRLIAEGAERTLRTRQRARSEVVVLIATLLGPTGQRRRTGEHKERRDGGSANSG